MKAIAFRSVVFMAAWGAAACGGPSAAKGPQTGGDSPTVAGADPAAEYAPLESGADYASWQKMNTESWISKTHGGRFVDVYVNDIGVAAFQDRKMAFPVGSIIVKSSWETKDGKATEVAGPLFVMEKKPAGFDPENEDWWYALHWEQVPAEWQKRMGGSTQVYWRTPSKKAAYCVGCHEKFPRHVSGVPSEKRAWEAQKAPSN